MKLVVNWISCNSVECDIIEHRYWFMQQTALDWLIVPNDFAKITIRNVLYISILPNI